MGAQEVEIKAILIFAGGKFEHWQKVGRWLSGRIHKRSNAHPLDASSAMKIQLVEVRI